MRTSSYFGIATILLWIGGLLTSNSQAAFDAYLKVDGIDGEAIEPRHTNWISILSFSATNTAADAMAQPPARFSSLCFGKRVDKASPLLAQRCAQGVFLPSVRLELIQTSGANVKFYEITLENVLIRSVTMTAAAVSPTSQPEESLCLDFGKITWVYTQLNSAGSPIEDVTAWWDVSQANGGFAAPPFRVTGELKISSEFQVSWPALAGKTYNIFGSATLSGPIQLSQRFIPAVDGIATQTFPASGPAMFFTVEQLP